MSDMSGMSSMSGMSGMSGMSDMFDVSFVCFRSRFLFQGQFCRTWVLIKTAFTVDSDVCRALEIILHRAQ